METDNPTLPPIVKVEPFNAEELISRLHQVTMLKDENVRAYADTFISLENISVADMHPPQRYVLSQELIKVRKLKWALAEKNIDLFRLDGFVRVYFEGYPEPIDVLPPIIEESIEQNGRVCHIVCDGMHRAYLAYLEWVIPQVVFIRGISKNLPYYSFPIPDRDWTKVEIREDIPSGFIKKWHRIENNKLLYRNFNSAFENVGGPRGNWKK